MAFNIRPLIENIRRLQFFRKKPPPDLAPRQGQSQQLARSINLSQLTLIGVGSTLGTGIFFVMAETAPLAGPAVVLAFILAALTAGLTALCYAEVATRLPVAGSSYTFTYITLGEGAAVLVAACLLLEWGIAGAAVAVGWSDYLNQFIELVTGHSIPIIWRTAPFSVVNDELVWTANGYVNLPAVVVVACCTLLLLRGAKDSARLNAILTTTKLAILLLFVAMSLTAFKQEHFSPFMPMGLEGVSSAAAIIFFSFVGLDSIVNASEEAINPQRNIPLAIMGALAGVTVVYVLVAVASLGVQPHHGFTEGRAGLAAILFQATGKRWSGIVLAAGAIISIFSVTLMTLFGQARIYFAMARDGLLPLSLTHIDAKRQCPRRVTILAGVAIAPVAALLPSQILWSAVSLGTLIVFVVICLVLIILRQSRLKGAPTKHFRVPGYPVTPLLSIAASLYLIAHLGATVFVLLACWLAMALVFYFLYGQQHARKHQGRIAT